MSRFNYTKKNFLQKDSIYNSFLVSLFIVNILKKGQKCLAKSLIYRALTLLKHRTKNVLVLLELAIKNIRPQINFKELGLRKGARTIIVTYELFKSVRVAIKWLIFSALQRAKKAFSINLANEIVDAASKRGLTLRKKKDFHRYVISRRTAVLL